MTKLNTKKKKVFTQLRPGDCGSDSSNFRKVVVQHFYNGRDFKIYFYIVYTYAYIYITCMFVYIYIDIDIYELEV